MEYCGCKCRGPCLNEVSYGKDYCQECIRDCVGSDESESKPYLEERVSQLEKEMKLIKRELGLK